MEFNDWLAARGFDNETLTDAMRTTLQAAWRAEQNPPAAGGTGTANKQGTPEAEFAETMAAFRAEEQRQRRVTAMVAEAIEATPGRFEDLETIGRKALANKWTEQETELALLRASRPSAPAVPGGGGHDRTPAAVIEAAVAQAAGLQDLEGSYDERTLEAAHKRYRGGMGVLQLLDVSARANGYRGHAAAKANLREVMEYAFPQRSGHGHYSPRGDSGVSSISTPGILSNVANKFVRESFMAVDRSILRIAARRSVTDFKQITSYSLSGDMTYKEIAPGGFLDHGTLGETEYTNRAKSYGRMLGLDRRDIINDDLGAYASVNRRLGRGGALKLVKTGWGVFLNNSSFFSSGNLNVSTGGGSALALAGLQAAENVFKVLKDPDGELMGVDPKLLVVPTALRATAWNLMNSTTTVATTTANTPLPDGNPWAGLYEIVSSPYMQDSTLTGYSAAAWYLLADPMDVPVIEVCYLNGVEMPMVESTDADFNQLGMQIRGVFDFGWALQEFRGGVRSAGS